MLTLGPAEAEEQLRDCMAIGADRGILLETHGEEWDAQATAAAIVEAIRAEEPFDLLLFGNESADAAGYQVGIRVAHALGLPVVTGLKKIELRRRPRPLRARRRRRARRVRGPAAGRAHGARRTEPAALPLRPRPVAREAEAARADAACPRPRAQLEKLRLVVPEGQGKEAEILGEGAAAAPRVVEVLQELGVA